MSAEAGMGPANKCGLWTLEAKTRKGVSKRRSGLLEELAAHEPTRHVRQALKGRETSGEAPAPACSAMQKLERVTTGRRRGSSRADDKSRNRDPTLKRNAGRDRTIIEGQPQQTMALDDPRKQRPG
jgi:hypothetical protein